MRTLYNNICDFQSLGTVCLCTLLLLTFALITWGSSNTEDIILIKTQSADFDYFFVNPNFLAIGHIPDLENC